jgi:FG-GAP-like repeat
MRRPSFATGLAVVLALAGTSGVLGAGISRTNASACGSLSLGSGASVKGSELQDVNFVSARQAWAVGDVFNTSTRENRTLVERYDGSGWSRVPSPNQSAGNSGLDGVSMISGGGWAVGYARQASGSYRPLALRWDGTQWSLALPTEFTGDALLTSVDTLADGSAWAAGFQTTAGGTRRTLIEHAVAGTWKRAASPSDGTATADNTLMSIGGTATTGLWAVGYRQSPTGLKALVLRYDTSLPSPSWVSVSGAGGVPSPGKVETVLSGVSVRTASDVWAVGYYDDGSVKRPLALHWNGSSWQNSQIPGAGLLRKVKVISRSNVWAVGTYYVPGERSTKTLVVHFDGTAWQTVQSADSPSANNQLIGISSDRSGSGLTLVGRQGPNTLVEQASCPTGPVSLPTRKATPAPAPPAAPGIGPAPTPPPPTRPPASPVPVTVTDRAAAAGIDENGALDWTFSAVAADFNGDGWVDVFVAHHWHPGHLWLNNHDGTFREADADFFKHITDRHDCHAADFNSDGRLDMFCTVGADRGTVLRSNALYLQQPGGTFTDQAPHWYVSDPTGRGRHGAVLDANNDGRPDVFSGAEPIRSDGLPSIDRLYLNTGHGSMLDSPAMGLDINIGALCSHTVDYNSDGWPDPVVCGDTFAAGLHIFRNNHGRGFQDVSSAVLGGPVAASDAVFTDINHNSRPDLITLTRTTLAERLQRADGTFTRPRTILTLRSGKSLAVGDVNGDHNPDLYVVGGQTANGTNAPDYLLLGDASGGYTSHPIPETTVGTGDRAYPLDYNHDGLTDFLVLNGQVPRMGPIQLLTPHVRAQLQLPGGR